MAPDTEFFAKKENLDELEQQVQAKTPRGITVVVLPPRSSVIEIKHA
jgi:hypothetical protein